MFISPSAFTCMRAALTQMFIPLHVCGPLHKHVSREVNDAIDRYRVKICEAIQRLATIGGAPSTPTARRPSSSPLPAVVQGLVKHLGQPRAPSSLSASLMALPCFFLVDAALFTAFIEHLVKKKVGADGYIYICLYVYVYAYVYACMHAAFTDMSLCLYRSLSRA